MTLKKGPRNKPNKGDRVLEELTSTGGATGIEASPDEAREYQQLPFDPASLDIDTRAMTVHNIVRLTRSSDLILMPEYQRRYGLWDDHLQSRLIESLLLRLPIPSLYLSEDDDGRYSVVDGVQRLSAIMRFVDPEALVQHVDARSFSPLRLVDLEYMSGFEGCTFRDLPFALQRRILDTPLVMHVIRRGTPEIVKFNVFERINTGGLPLSGQELRSALIGGQARDILRALADSPEFLEATAGSVSQERLADQELILRFFALDQIWPWEYFDRSVGKSFLNDAMHAMNDWSHGFADKKISVFKTAMVNAARLFGEHAFRKISLDTYRPFPINRALFETEAVLCGHISTVNRSTLTERRTTVTRRLARELESNVDFWRAVSQATGSGKAVSTRFEVMQRIFRRADLA
jgi:hypothetical protein